MKTIASKNTVVNSPNLTSSGFTIRQKNLAKIINIVENDIYSDKILAVIREYSCNAYDANVEAGKRDVPIVVNMPSRLSPEFKVRDNGNGLTEQEIHEVYTSYGESTKENSDDYIGQLGIGSKSGFAYGDNFVVTSWKNGTKTVYNAVKGSDVREMVKLYSEPSNDPSGIEVSIPVKTGDEAVFKSKSINFFKYWQTQPHIVGVSEQETKTTDVVIIDGGDWKVVDTENSYARNHRAIAIMGNISYPIQWDLVMETLNKNNRCDFRTNSIVRFITNNSVVIRFKIGEIQMAPSREALQYTEHTVSNIVKKLEQICGELENILIAQINSAKTLWEYKCNINCVFSRQVKGDRYLSNYGLLENLELIFELVKPKLTFNGVNVLNPNYDGMNEWDRNLGKVNIEERVKNFTKAFDPLVYAYSLTVRNKLNIETASHTNHLFRFTASDRNQIMIMDMDRKTHVKQCLKWYIGTNNIGRLYVLYFGNDAVKTSFFAKNDMSGATIVKFSDVFAKFKPLIPKRKSTGKLEDNTVKCGILNPTNRFSYYSRNTLDKLWEYRSEVNLKTESGYYLDYSNNESVTINGEKMGVCMFMGVVNELHYERILNLTHINKVHGFGTTIINGKKFAQNKSNWTNIVDYIETELKNLNKDEYVFSALMNERIEKFDLNLFYIHKGVLNQFVTRLTHDNMFSDLYKIMPEISESTNEKMKLLERIKVSCVQTYHQKALKQKIENGFNLIAAKYPMLKTLIMSFNWNNIDTMLQASVVDEIVNYINFVDSTTKKV
jgi:hypothetical protein